MWPGSVKNEGKGTVKTPGCSFLAFADEEPKKGRWGRQGLRARRWTYGRIVSIGLAWTK